MPLRSVLCSAPRSTQPNLIFLAVLLLSACNGGGSNGNVDDMPDDHHAIGGTVSGLVGSGLVLQLNGANDLEIKADGDFQFVEKLEENESYEVTVAQQPVNPLQHCSVANGSGPVGSADITGVSIACVRTFTVGGTVTGFVGQGLVLQLNGADDLSISEDGEFSFAQPLPDGVDYHVTVKTQPSNPDQTCTVEEGKGSLGGTNVTGVMVQCTTDESPAAATFTVGGTVTGLAGSGLTLRINGAGDLVVSQNGMFEFPAALSDGTAYSVSVHSQPMNPNQTCTVVSGSGTIAGAKVENITVTCASKTYTVGGSVAGLVGSGLVLRINGAGDLAITGNGTFTFAAPLADGSGYSVSVHTQPTGPTQVCTVQSGSGILHGAKVTDVMVSCSAPKYAVGVTVNGLLGSGLVLRFNSGSDIAIAHDGSFTLAEGLANDAAYEVTVQGQPAGPNQVCGVTDASGNIDAQDVDLTVSCTTTTYQIGGSVTGLAGSGLSLRLNDAFNLLIAADGMFVFTNELDDGSEFAVTVNAQPTQPEQQCTVSDGTGHLSGGDVTAIVVTCVTPPPQYTIGGTVLGLESSTGLVLQNNGGDDLAITGDGAFEFDDSVDDSAGYAVTVLAQPAGPALECTVENGTGAVSGADVSDVVVHCEGWRDEGLVETATGNASTPHVAFEAGGDAVAVWTQLVSGSVQVLTSRYDAANETWSAPGRRDSQSYDAAAARIAIDASGNALIVWQQLDAGGVYSIWASRYSSSSETWSAAELLESGAGEAAFPQVAFDASGNALAVWSQRVDGTFLARYDVWAKRYVAGSGWAAEVLIESSDAGNAVFPKVAFDGSGNAFATWHQFDGTRYNVWANRYDASTGWGTATLIESDDAGSALYPELAVSSAGDAIVVWQQHDGTRNNVVANRYAAGGTWGSAEPLESTTDAATYPDVAIDANGNALAVWRQYGSSASVWAARFDEATTTWQAAESLETGGADGGSKELEVAFDPDGNAIAIYGVLTGSVYDVSANRYVAGEGWRGSMPVEAGSLTATSAQLAFEASGKGLAVWAQVDGSGYRNVFFNIYR